jgi:hypothetical protein
MNEIKKIIADQQMENQKKMEDNLENQKQIMLKEINQVC